MVLVITACIILVLAFLLYLDFQQGKKAYQKNPPVIHFNNKNAKYDLFTSGDSFFEAFFKDIKNAKESVDVQFFIVRNDEISLELYDLLTQKAKAGLKVRLLVDQIGSLKLKKKHINDLRKSGVEFAYSDKPSLPYFFYKLNRRNHRKITIIDKKIGYFGGYNVGKEYVGKDPKLSPWRDYHMKITGEAVNSFEKIFKLDWTTAITGHTQRGAFIGEKADKDLNKLNIIGTESGQLEENLVHWISQAKSEILIGSPYFIPSNRVFDALLSAAGRGVEIHVILPIKGDHPFVKPAGIPYMQRLTKAGGKVHLFNDGFYHAKVIIIDEKFCDIGTANFDMRSMLINKEVNSVISSDDNFIKDIRTAFFQDMKVSQPFSETWVKNQPILTKVAMIFVPLIKPLL